MFGDSVLLALLVVAILTFLLALTGS